MCGLVGIASCSTVSDRAWVSVGRDAMNHRGPDGFGEWWSADGQVGFAHRRLAIVDLSSTGHQPMHDAAGETSIIFNGEIYNFVELRQSLVERGSVFRSSSDTEVILAAYREWGIGCLSRLNGMFAFALYDARRRNVFFARDRAGEKPLYFHHSGGVLRFASELKALLVDSALPRRIEPEALECYLSMGFVPGGQCILQGFNKLAPAHALQFDLQTGKLRLWRYWAPPEVSVSGAQGPIDEIERLVQLEILLEDAVRRQMVADVPVGVLLSGGVDSSLITAMAARVSNTVQTFTIGFPGHGKLDETNHARLIARHFGTQHTELIAEPATADLLPQLARQFDEPMVDSSMIPTFLVSQLVRQHCKVALGGDGGDELFGGYGHYSRLLQLQRILGWIPHSLRKSIALAAKHFLPLGFAGTNIRTWLMAIGQDFQLGLPQIATCFDSINRQELLINYHGYGFAAERVYLERVPVNPDLLQRATRMDFANYLAEDILVKVDRASMLNSLEVRAPLLDYRLIEFAFAKVPSRSKTTPTDKKILLKRLTQRVLPTEFDRRRKQGFSIPLANWLKEGVFRDMFHEVLRDPECSFDSQAIERLLSAQDRGRSNGERLFALVLFELWRREYRVTL